MPPLQFNTPWPREEGMDRRGQHIYQRRPERRRIFDPATPPVSAWPFNHGPESSVASRTDLNNELAGNVMRHFETPVDTISEDTLPTSQPERSIQGTEPPTAQQQPAQPASYVGQ